MGYRLYASNVMLSSDLQLAPSEKHKRFVKQYLRLADHRTASASGADARSQIRRFSNSQWTLVRLTRLIPYTAAAFQYGAAVALIPLLVFLHKAQ